MPTRDLPPLFAMYVQATHQVNAGATTRRQWITFPPLTEEYARQVGPKADPMPMMLHFWRTQQSLDNRPKWRHGFYEPGDLERDLPRQIESARQAAWEVSPVITAEVSARELVELHAEPTTPYRMLRRFAAVAKSRHNVAI